MGHRLNSVFERMVTCVKIRHEEGRESGETGVEKDNTECKLLHKDKDEDQGYSEDAILRLVYVCVIRKINKVTRGNLSTQI